MLAFDKTFNDRAAPVKGSGKVSSFYKKNVHPNKASKTGFNLTFTQLMNSQTSNYYRSL